MFHLIARREIVNTYITTPVYSGNTVSPTLDYTGRRIFNEYTKAQISRLFHNLGITQVVAFGRGYGGGYTWAAYGNNIVALGYKAQVDIFDLETGEMETLHTIGTLRPQNLGLRMGLPYTGRVYNAPLTEEFSENGFETVDGELFVKTPENVVRSFVFLGEKLHIGIWR